MCPKPKHLMSACLFPGVPCCSIDQLRAIPWIFAWTQTRFHLPVWLGIGDAFQVHPNLVFSCAHLKGILRSITPTCD